MHAAVYEDTRHFVEILEHVLYLDSTKTISFFFFFYRFGGPHAAFMASKHSYSRRMSGRIIGVTIDSRGAPALRMAMQTREQHIRYTIRWRKTGGWEYRRGGGGSGGGEREGTHVWRVFYPLDLFIVLFFSC